jgi:biopolymer transport protein ExbD
VVIVNADQGTSYGLVVQVMDKARKIGVRKFALATEPEGERRKK